MQRQTLLRSKTRRARFSLIPSATMLSLNINLSLKHKLSRIPSAHNSKLHSRTMMYFHLLMYLITGATIHHQLHK